MPYLFKMFIGLRIAAIALTATMPIAAHAGITGLVPPLEAENATGSGGVVANANAGFTGTGYLQFVGEGFIEWAVNVPRDGLYQLEVRYADTANRSLNIRNTSFTFSKTATFAATGGLSKYKTVDVFGKLTSGSNTVRLESTGGGMPNVDHLLVSFTPPDANKFLGFPVHSSDVMFRGTDANTTAYYATIDPLSEKLTLDAWKTKNGFVGSSAYAKAKYFNAGDLGLGRSMYVVKNLQSGSTVTANTSCSVASDINCNVASYVQNYPTLQDAIDGTNLLATVAMEYSPRINSSGNFDTNKPKFTKFYVFDAAGNRLKKIDLDGRGEKFVPGLCNVCHGGKPKLDHIGPSNPGYADGGDTGARWIPWDLNTYDFHATLTQAAQESEFKKLNQSILDTSPSSATNGLIHGWYGGSTMSNATFNGNYVPSGWSNTTDGNKSNLYLQVFAPTCRSCHYQRETRNNSGHVIFQGELLEQTLAFGTYANFKTYKKEIEYLIYDSGLMPAAKRTFENFWRSQQAVTLDNELFGGTAMQTPPASIYDFNSVLDFGAWRRPGRPQPNIAGIGSLFGTKTSSANGNVCFQGPIYDMPNARSGQVVRLNGGPSLFPTSGFNWSYADNNSCFPGTGPTISGAKSQIATFNIDPAKPQPYLIKLVASNEFSSVNRMIFGRLYFNNSLQKLTYVDDIYPMLVTQSNTSTQSSTPLTCVHCHSNGNVVNRADGIFNLMDFQIPAGDTAAKQSFSYRMALTRIDCNDPESSLLIRKPSGHAHYNGTTSGFENWGNSNDANNRAILLRWIMEGAAYSGSGTNSDFGCKLPLRFIKVPSNFFEIQSQLQSLP